MRKEIRRSKQTLTNEQIDEVFSKGIYGILAINNSEGYPYPVPLNYCYLNQKIYFHCAKTGYKNELLKMNPKVGFNVVSNAEVLPARLSMAYYSVTCEGEVEIIDDTKEKIMVLKGFIEKYGQGASTNVQQVINKYIDQVEIIKLSINEINGKISKELLKE